MQAELRALRAEVARLRATRYAVEHYRDGRHSRYEAPTAAEALAMSGDPPAPGVTVVWGPAEEYRGILRGAGQVVAPTDEPTIVEG